MTFGSHLLPLRKCKTSIFVKHEEVSEGNEL